MFKVLIAFAIGLTAPITVPAAIDVVSDVVDNVESNHNSRSMMSNPEDDGMMSSGSMKDREGMMNGGSGHCHDSYVENPDLITPEVDVIE